MSAYHEVPEISDLVVRYDPDTLERLDVSRDDVLDELSRHRMARAVRIVEEWPARRGVLDAAHVDGVLLRSHLEMQRLSEEFQQGARMLRLLRPALAAIRETGARKLRIVDVGCGLGYVTRWLAAHGELGDDVELVGCDYNAALVAEAQRLARLEGSRCTFLVRNAFALDEPAALFTSTGVIHHFRGSGLTAFFREQDEAGAAGFVHCDIKPSWLAPLGAWVFHEARMREPLAKVDGVLSAARAHTIATLAAAAAAVPMRLFAFDGAPERFPLLRVMQALVGLRGDAGARFVDHLGPLRSRVREVLR